MSRAAQAWLLGAVAVAALVAGVLLRPTPRGLAPSPVPEAAGATLLQTTLPDLAGTPQRLDQWKGKVLVVNFWATWCAPCRDEIPALVTLQRELGGQGLQVVGIAIDQLDKVRPYAAEMGINYPILIGELGAIDLARQAGNELGALPFTVVLDRNGHAVRGELGRVTEAKLAALVRPLL
ncbi:MAG TPA: TlpA disulfide reductase family protein [Burkholderiales bacterium]|jgi:thiol-disulfide isomerase/thioredoxin